MTLLDDGGLSFRITYKKPGGFGRHRSRQARRVTANDAGSGAGAVLLLLFVVWIFPYHAERRMLDATSREVDIFPLQAEHFTRAHPDHGKYGEHRLVWLGSRPRMRVFVTDRC
jgi:hypothetical protein